MNTYVTLTYEERARANAKAIRAKLYGPPKVVNVIREVLAQKVEEAKRGKAHNEEPAEHVKAYYLWHSRTFKQTSMSDYADRLCEHKGTTREAISGIKRSRAMTHILDYVVFEVREMFPKKTWTEIGSLVNREHSSIIRSVERESLRRGITPQETTCTEFPELHNLLRQGRTLKEIAAVYGVGISTISRRVHAMGLSNMLQSKTKPMSTEFIERVREDYVAGHSLSSISEKYGISARSITNWKNTFGWPVRDNAKAGRKG